MSLEAPFKSNDARSLKKMMPMDIRPALYFYVFQGQEKEKKTPDLHVRLRRCQPDAEVHMVAVASF